MNEKILLALSAEGYASAIELMSKDEGSVKCAKIIIEKLTQAHELLATYVQN